MPITRTQTVSHPMLYVTARVSMDPGEISTTMDTAFKKLEGFIAQNHVAPVGAPLAIYRDWDGKAMAVDVGFPVNAIDLEKAAGDVLAGKSPEGPAAKALHKGPYAALRDTYGTVEGEMKKAGMRSSGLPWEVYIKGPGMAEEADFETEIYMQLAEADTARAQAAG